nr:MAG TPA: hypothetical protein [Caudoviricetes sp.]
MLFARSKRFLILFKIFYSYYSHFLREIYRSRSV